MQNSPSLQSEFASAQLSLANASDVFRFEFLCGFSHWLLCQFEESLRNAPAGANCVTQYASIGTACALAARVVRDAPQLSTDGWEFTECKANDEASKTIAFALQRAAREAKNPEHPWESSRRWASGQSEETLATHAVFKSEYLVTLMSVMFEELPQLLSFSDDENPTDLILAKTTALGACSHCLSGLAAIAKFHGSDDSKLQALRRFVEWPQQNSVV